MLLDKKHTGLYTDFYELTMAQGYLQNNMAGTQAGFDYFFRSNPYGGGYTIFAGLTSLLEMLIEYRFERDACEFLKSRGFNNGFLRYLEDFRFRGDVYSVEEGELVFPYEPIVRVEGNLIETQLMETLLLNVLNFESLIATKAARIRMAAGDRTVIDFGLRRAHGLGGIQASKAAISGGVDMTSNVFSAFRYDLDTSGTMAHSWVQSFSDELTAFRAYADAYPDNCILLVDTYDTLKSGIPNAIKVGKEMAGKGKSLAGIRLDSGDMAELSKQARKMLDDAGLGQVKIVASNQLDEFAIRDLLSQSVPIDAFGVGTALTTGKDAGALDGVYKLCSVGEKPSLKISSDPAKATLPGRKDLYRFVDEKGVFMADGITLTGEPRTEELNDPADPGTTWPVNEYRKFNLMKKVVESGKIAGGIKFPHEVSDFSRKRISSLPADYTRMDNPLKYRVGISSRLLNLRNELSESYTQ